MQSGYREVPLLPEVSKNTALTKNYTCNCRKARLFKTQAVFGLLTYIREGGNVNQLFEVLQVHTNTVEVL